MRPPAIREHLIDQGFAWAASSYRCNGYVPGIGLQDTMALTDLFTKFNGGTAPRRVYLTGTSMGGHVTLLGMHEFPTSFAGGLAMCPGRAGALRLLHGQCGGGGSDHRRRGFKEHGDAAAGSGAYERDARHAAELHREGTAAGQRADSPERRTAAVRGRGTRVRRPFAGNISSGAAALAGGTSPANRAVGDDAHPVQPSTTELGLSADRLNQLCAGRPPTPTFATRWGRTKKSCRSTAGSSGRC